jgi:molybdopterin converting factor small subunit
MAIVIPPVRLAKALRGQILRSSAPTVGELLQELKVQLAPADWAWLQGATILVEGRPIHQLRGLATPLRAEDQVWMVFPSGGG